MRYIPSKITALAAAVILGVTGCADLDVANPNAPDADLALSRASDVETLIRGSYRQWWSSSHSPTSGAFVFANMSFQMSSWPANFGMVAGSRLPRQPVNNVGLDEFYDEFLEAPWRLNYRALSAVAQGLRALEDPDIAAGLGDDLLRAQAFARFMQGLGHGSIALFYGQGHIVDETKQLVDEDNFPIEQPLVSYEELLQASLGYFDQAIALAESGDFTLPSSWMSVAVTSDELARIAHSMKARYRANVARTPAEREAVDWNAVIADVDAGVQNGWNKQYDGWLAGTWWNGMLGYNSLSWIGWNQESMMITGMADQSGNYQEWLSVMPPENREPDLPSGEPFLIVSPDQRFAQGETMAEQEANQTAGTMIQINGGPFVPPNNWGQPARGMHRWSYYRNNTGDTHIFFGEMSHPEITTHEMRLLKAEGYYRLGNAAAAADLINVTRVGVGGLSPADPAAANDGNDSCVPRLPDGTCGDLLEMLKWEKRLHTRTLGVHSNTWYFDGRGWGDLYAGTPLELPVPCDENQAFGRPCENTGGVGGSSAAAGSVYNWPGEL